MQASDEKQLELSQEHCDWHLQILIEDARKTRQQEAGLSREYFQHTSAFNHTSLGTLSQVVQVLMVSLTLYLYIVTLYKASFILVHISILVAF